MEDDSGFAGIDDSAGAGSEVDDDNEFVNIFRCAPTGTVASVSILVASYTTGVRPALARAHPAMSLA
jgi:hypothetical protein